MKFFFGIILIVGVIGSVLGADTRNSPVFRKALEYYTLGKYDSTITIIRNHLKVHGKDEESLYMVPLIAEAMVRVNDFSSFHRIIDMYRSKYPSSEFNPRLSYLEGVAFAKQEKYTPALYSFSSAYEQGLAPDLQNALRESIENICSSGLSLDEISTQIQSQGTNGFVVEILRYYEVVKLNEGGQFTKASHSVEEFRRDYPGSRYDANVKSIVSRSRDRRKDQVQVGLLAPLSGESADLGKRVTQGVQLAVDTYNSSMPGTQLKLIIYDTKGEAVETARKSYELLEQDKVPIVIGPVLSHTTAVSAGMFMKKDITLISPTATDDGIASLGPNIFQMNVTLGILGRSLARYSIDNLNIREFAIIAPRTPYGVLMAQSFREELQKRNVELVSEQYFDESTNDFSSQFGELRSKLLLRHLNKLASNRGSDRIRSSISRSDSIRYLDSTLTIGGLFMPAEAEDVVMLAPQVFFNRIRSQILGSSGWHSPKVVLDGKRYVTNAVISTTSELEIGSKEWADFKRDYKARYNSEPDKVSALGYDAAQLVIKAIQEGGAEASKIAKALSGVQGYRGLSGVISFASSGGANTEAAIMKITDTGFIRIH